MKRSKKRLALFDFYVHRIAYHHQDSKTTADQRLSNVKIHPIAINCTPLVEKIFHCLVARKNNHGFASEHETVHWTIFLRPPLELEMHVLLWYLLQSQTHNTHTEI